MEVRDIISLILLAVSGLAMGPMDLSSDSKYEDGTGKNKDETWGLKYRRPLKEPGSRWSHFWYLGLYIPSFNEKFPFSSTVFSWVNDFWHRWKKVSMSATFVVLLLRPDPFGVWWWNGLAFMLAFLIPFNIIYHWNNFKLPKPKNMKILILTFCFSFLLATASGQVNCDQCDTLNPQIEFSVYVTNLQTGPGGVSVIQFSVYGTNMTQQDLWNDVIEFSAFFDSGVLDIASVQVEHATWQGIPVGIGLSPVGTDSMYLEFDIVNYTQFEDTYFQPLIPVLMLNITVNLNQPVQITDPEEYCSQDLIQFINGHCLQPNGNVNNQFGFHDANGNTILQSCYSYGCEDPFIFLDPQFVGIRGESLEDGRNFIKWTLTDIPEEMFIRKWSEDGILEQIQISPGSCKFVDMHPSKKTYYQVIADQVESDIIVLYSEPEGRWLNFDMETKTLWTNGFGEFVSAIVFDSLGRKVCHFTIQREQTLDLPAGWYCIYVNDVPPMTKPIVVNY